MLQCFVFIFSILLTYSLILLNLAVNQFSIKIYLCSFTLLFKNKYVFPLACLLLLQVPMDLFGVFGQGLGNLLQYVLTSLVVFKE